MVLFTASLKGAGKLAPLLLNRDSLRRRFKEVWKMSGKLFNYFTFY